MCVHECVKESRCLFLSKVIVKANSLASRQKRKILLNAKLAILDSLYKGNGQARLAEEYGVEKLTISNTKKSDKKIRGYVTVLDNQSVSTSRKVMRLAKEEPGKVGFYYSFILVSGRICSISQKVFMWQ